jgi:hypothetical protein
MKCMFLLAVSSPKLNRNYLKKEGSTEQICAVHQWLNLRRGIQQAENISKWARGMDVDKCIHFVMKKLTRVFREVQYMWCCCMIISSHLTEVISNVKCNRVETGIFIILQERSQ